MNTLYTTVSEICERGDLSKNARTIEPCHLHYNGPGAAGFGVKKTAMLLPESVMLLVAPSCCGRHGTVTGNKSGFDSRMFYLEITERDLVTGKYLQRIPEAARLVAANKPRAIFLCMTCVDALMGTDLQRIAGQVEAETGIRTVGSFMDPIAREGRRAPMVSVQTAIMSCLEPSVTDRHAANIVGNFVPLDGQSELYELLRSYGFTTVRQISACDTYEEYMRMAEASVNVVINPQAVAAARDMEERLGIPYVHIRNCFGPDRIGTEEGKLIEELGRIADMDAGEIAGGIENETADETAREIMRRERACAEKRSAEFKRKYGNLRFAVGEAVNGSNLELALTLLEAGLNVEYVLKNIVNDYDVSILERINNIKPDLRVYSGVHPSVGRMYDNVCAELPEVDVTIGLDAGYLSPESSSVCRSTEEQHFGYSGLSDLIEETADRIEKPIQHKEQIKGSYLTV